MYPRKHLETGVVNAQTSWQKLKWYFIRASKRVILFTSSFEYIDDFITENSARQNLCFSITYQFLKQTITY